MQPPAPLPIRIVAYPGGGGSVEIEDTDYSAGTEGLRLDMVEGQPSVLTLWRKSDAIAVEGSATIHIATEDSGAAQTVREMDPAQLKAKALEGQGLGGGDLVASVLELVAQALERT